MLFVGTYDHTIDAKQRMAIPSEVRDRLDAERDGEAFYVTIMEGPTLRIYTEKGFEKRSDDLENSERGTDEVLSVELALYPLTQRVEPDKQGRIRIPEFMLKLVGLTRDVTVVGVRDHLQVHDREAWQARMKELIEEQQHLLMNPRRLMKPADGNG